MLELPEKSLAKAKIELFFLEELVSCSHSFRDEFTKERMQHGIELFMKDDKIMYLACYDT